MGFARVLGLTCERTPAVLLFHGASHARALRCASGRLVGRPRASLRLASACSPISHPPPQSLILTYRRAAAACRPHPPPASNDARLRSVLGSCTTADLLTQGRGTMKGRLDAARSDRGRCPSRASCVRASLPMKRRGGSTVPRCPPPRRRGQLRAVSKGVQKRAKNRHERWLCAQTLPIFSREIRWTAVDG